MPTLPVEGSIGDRIREARILRGITQAELADRLGLYGKASVSTWETGLRTPHPVNIEAIAKALNVTVAYLLDGEAFDPEKQAQAEILQTEVLNALLRLEERQIRLEKKVDQIIKTLDQWE